MAHGLAKCRGCRYFGFVSWSKGVYWFILDDSVHFVSWDLFMRRHYALSDVVGIDGDEYGFWDGYALQFLLAILVQDVPVEVCG